MSMVDMSGQPDSDKNLQDAIDCMGTVMVKHATAIPLLTVHSGIIHRCLVELQRRRTREGTPVSRNEIMVILDKHLGFAEATEELYNLFIGVKHG